MRPQDILSSLGHFGWIPPAQRTQAQQDAHEAALARRVAFTLAPPDVPKGTKILLTDFWKTPDVVADLGCEFTGFHQLTGSCVGASAGNAILTLVAVQRTLADSPTKAFIPWWLYPYGRTRFNEGDRGEGEGALDSVMGQTLADEGSFDAGQSGLPRFKTNDGFYLTEQIEMQWSDGGAVDQKWLSLGKQNTLGSHATMNSPDDVWAAVANGYPVLDGCDNYVGNGSIRGGGSDAYVTGRYDGRGGHSTCFLGVYNHANDGRLFLYSNQWPTSTYPRDPAGAGRCCVWLPEDEVAKLFRTGGSGGETMALSHQHWFPSVPKLQHWYA